MKKRIFFTVVIPTRERSDTLVSTIRSIQSQDYPEFQILVSDNASVDDTKQKVEHLNDERIRYINTGKRVSMSDNWEFALGHVEDGWVTVLGDDDALLPGSLASARKIIEATGVKAIRSNGCSFSWPCLQGAQHGVLTVSIKRGYETRNSEQMLAEVLGGKLSYNELPMLYNGGFVSMDIIRAAKATTGRLFLSMTPDVYTAVLFSFLTDQYVYSHEPLAINGASAHSGGTAGFEKSKRSRSYDPAQKFWSEPNIPFHSDLPLMSSGRPVRSIPAIVYESYLQAAPFHSLKSVRTTRKEQLELILSKSGPDPQEIAQWAEAFCSMHGLELRQARARAHDAIVKNARGVFSRLGSAVSSFRVEGSDNIRLKYVSEAAVVAGVVKDLRPSALKCLLPRLKRQLG